MEFTHHLPHTTIRFGGQEWDVHVSVPKKEHPGIVTGRDLPVVGGSSFGALTTAGKGK